MVRDARTDEMLRVLVWEKEEGGERKGEAEMKMRVLGGVEGKERQRQVSTEQTAEVHGRIKHKQEGCSKKDRRRAQDLNGVSKIGWSAHVLFEQNGCDWSASINYLIYALPSNHEIKPRPLAWDTPGRKEKQAGWHLGRRNAVRKRFLTFWRVSRKGGGQGWAGCAGGEMWQTPLLFTPSGEELWCPCLVHSHGEIICQDNSVWSEE